jgi:hypothetical protein
MEATTQYVVRKQSNFAYTYGLGEVVSEGVTLFRAGNYDLSFDDLQAKLAKAVPRKAH